MPAMRIFFITLLYLINSCSRNLTLIMNFNALQRLIKPAAGAPSHENRIEHLIGFLATSEDIQKPWEPVKRSIAPMPNFLTRLHLIFLCAFLLRLLFCSEQQTQEDAHQRFFFFFFYFLISFSFFAFFSCASMMWRCPLNFWEQFIITVRDWFFWSWKQWFWCITRAVYHIMMKIYHIRGSPGLNEKVEECNGFFCW